MCVYLCIHLIFHVMIDICIQILIYTCLFGAMVKLIAAGTSAEQLPLWKNPKLVWVS